MESVVRARERFAKYPVIFAKCTRQATVYARCVLLHEEVKKDSCSEEFKEFSACLKAAAKDMKTKI